MPRLPGVSNVTRVSNDGLRLPALNAPATDPTGAALQDFGRSLGNFGEAFDDFARKRKLLKEAEQKLETREVKASLSHKRATTPSDDRAVSGADGFFFEDAEEEIEGSNIDENRAVVRGIDNPSLDPVEEFGDAIVQRFGDPAQQKKIKEVVETEKKFHLIERGVEAQNRRAAGLASRVDRILGRHLETVLHKPAMHKSILEEGLQVLSENQAAVGWSDEALRARKRIFQQNFDTSILRGRLSRGEIMPVIELLDDPEIRDMLGESNATELTREAVNRKDSEAFAVMNSRDLNASRIEDNGIGIEGLPERAAAILTPELFDDFEVAQSRARALFEFGQRHGASSKSEIRAGVDALRSAEGTGEEDQKTFEAVRAKSERMIAERHANPAADAERDAAVAAVKASGDHEQAITLSFAVQNKREVPEALQKALPKAETRQMAADLDAFPVLARGSELLKLKKKYGKHFDAVLAEMRAEGLDPETLAIAAIADNPKALQALLPALGTPYAQLTQDKTPEQIADLQSSVETQRVAMVQQGRLDPSIEPSILRKAALREFDQTGDTKLSVNRAIETFVDTENTAAADDDSLQVTVGDGTLPEDTGSDILIRVPSNDSDGLNDPRAADEDGSDLNAPNLSETNTDLSPSVAGLLTGREADLRNSGRDLVAQLRAKVENNQVHDDKSQRELEEKIRSIFPFDNDLQDVAITLLRGSQFKRETRDREGEETLLKKLEVAVNNPDTLRKMRESEDFRNTYSDTERDAIFEARVEPRKKRDRIGTILLRFAKSHSNEQQRLQEAIKERESLPKGAGRKLFDDLDRKIERLQGAISSRENSIRLQASRLSEANKTLAGMLSTPHPAVDKSLALRQETIETREDRARELVTDSVLLSGGIASGFLKKGVARTISSGALTLTEATIAYNRGFSDRVAKAFQSANIDMTDESEIRKFAQKNENLIRRITNQAILDVLEGVVSKQAAKSIGKLLDLNPIGEAIAEEISKGVIGIARDELK